MKLNDTNDNERAEWEHEDLASVKIRVYHGHKNKVSSINFCSNHEKIFSSSYDNTCKIWNIANGTVLETYFGHNSFVNYAELNNEESQFLSCGWDSCLKLSDIETRQNLLSVKFAGIVTCGKFSSNSDLIVAGSDLDNLVNVIDLKSGDKVKTIKGLHKSTPTSCQFISSDNRLITTSMDRTCKIYDLRTDSVTITLEDHLNVISYADVTDNEHLLATASWDKSLLVYDINSGTYRSNGPLKLMNGHEGSVSCCQFSRDRNLLISGGYDSNIVLWDMKKHVKELKLQGHVDWVENVKISDDNHWILSCSKDHTIRLWNIEHSDKFQPSTASFIKASKGFQVFEAFEDPNLMCPRCGKTYKGTNDSMCVFCRLQTDSNESMKIVKQKFSLIPM